MNKDIRKNNIRRLRLDLISLTVFGNVRSDGVISALMRLLACLDDSAQTAEDMQLEATALYCELSAEIASAGGDISKHVEMLASRGTDLYTEAAAAGRDPGSILESALERELSILQSVAELGPEPLTGAFDAPPGLMAWKTSPVDLDKTFHDMIDGISTRGFGIYAMSCMFREKDCELEPVIDPEYQTLDHLYGYRREREEVLKNTAALAAGRRAGNVLLYGDAGTGKSSTVKACAAAYADSGVRLIEFERDQIEDIPVVAEKVRSVPLKFIFFIDDLSFEQGDRDFYALKGILEGGISGTRNNIVIYATSNRRHLIREKMEEREGNDIHRNDTIQEELSLSARFGLTITFSKPAKDLYLEIVTQIADEYGLEYDEADLCRRAEAFAVRSGGRSPRTAKQFVILAGIGIR